MNDPASVAEIDDEWLEWQDEVCNSPLRYNAVSGGLACGKTNLVPKVAADQALRFPGTRGAIGMPTFEQLEDSVHVEIQRYFTEKRLRADFKSDRWIFSNGSTIIYRSFKVPVFRLKGPQYDWGIIDEADNDEVTKDRWEAFDGRIGRDHRSSGSGKIWVFCNPVSHGHWVYQEFREAGDAEFRLWEIPTHANVFLPPSYIRKQERRYPPGSPGRDRWLLGKCGIPHERAVFRFYKYERHRVSPSQLEALGGCRRFRSALHLHEGQPVGWLRVGFTDTGVMVPVRELQFEGDSPREIAERVRETIEQTRDTEPEHLPVLADSSHEMFKLVSAAGLRLSPARTNTQLGIGRLRNVIQRNRLMLIRGEDNLCRTPNLLVELEEHRFSEEWKLEEKRWSFVRPLEFIAINSNLAGPAGQRAARDLASGLGAPAPSHRDLLDSHRRGV